MKNRYLITYSIAILALLVFFFVAYFYRGQKLDNYFNIVCLIFAVLCTSTILVELLNAIEPSQTKRPFLCYALFGLIFLFTMAILFLLTFFNLSILLLIITIVTASVVSFISECYKDMVIDS